MLVLFFFFQAEDGIRDYKVTGVQTCALPIYWVIPPESDAEYVAQMEDVLDTYAKPYNAAHPVIDRKSVV